jgi:ATP-dependent DNA ligase
MRVLLANSTLLAVSTRAKPIVYLTESPTTNDVQSLGDLGDVTMFSRPTKSTPNLTRLTVSRVHQRAYAYEIAKRAQEKAVDGLMQTSVYGIGKNLVLYHENTHEVPIII